MNSRRHSILARISWLLVLAVLTNYFVWDFSGFGFVPTPAPKANAQAAQPLTYYFKGDSIVTPTRAANGYFGVAGPTVENSSDTGVNIVPGQATALGMIPIAGLHTPANTSLTVAAYGVVTNAFTNTPDVDMAWIRTFIMPLASGTVFKGTGTTSTFNVRIAALESNGALNGYIRAYIYVYDSAANNVAKVLAGPTSNNNELGTSMADQEWAVANAMGGADYTSGNTDYLAVEIWVDATTRTSATRTASIRWGGNTAVSTTDGTANATPASGVIIGATPLMDTFDPIYLQPTSADHAPTPTAHQAGDSFQNGTWAGRRAGTVAGAGAETKAQTLTVTGNPLYYRMNTWTSPPLAAQTIPAANWVIHFHGDETATTNNAYPRWSIYVWKGDDTGVRGTIYARANASIEFGALTTNNQIEDVVAGSSVAVTAGDRLVIDVEAVSLAASTTGPVNFKFGDAASTPGISVYDSAVLPPMNYASTPTPLAYQAQQYDQTHFQFDQDTEDETHVDWTNGDGSAVAIDTTAVYSVSTNFRARIQIANRGGETDTLTPLLYYSTAETGTYTQVTNTTTDMVGTIASGWVAQNEVTTRQLTDMGTGWDFSAGRVVETSGVATTAVSMTAWTFTEYEWSLYSETANTYYLRVRDDTTVFTTYTNTASVTIQAPQLGLSAPGDVVLNDGTPNTTTETTFGEAELVAVTNAGAGWSLTLVSSAITGLPTVYIIPASNVKLRTDGTEGGGGDIYTIWSGETTNVAELSAGTYALDTPQTVGTRSSGADTAVTNVRPTIQVVIPSGAEIENYTGTLTFTVA